MPSSLMDMRPLSHATDPRFLAQAWAQYLKSCMQGYQEMMSAVSELMLHDDDESNSRGAKSYSELVNEVLAAHHIPTITTIALQKGYANIRNLGLFIAEQTEAYSDIAGVDPAAHLTEPQPFTLYTSRGIVASTTVSLSEILEDLKTSLQSSAVAQAALEATAGESASDRLNILKDRVSSMYENVYSDMSSTYSTFSRMLSTGWTGVGDFLTEFRRIIGVIDQSDYYSDWVPLNADISGYTGANPLLVVDWDAAVKAAEQGVETTGRAIGGLVYAMMRGLDWVGHKMEVWVNKNLHTLFNPFDIKVVNDKATSPTIDRFGIQGYNDTYETTRACYFPSAYWGSDMRSAILDKVNSLTNSWIKVNNIFYEMFFRLRSVESLYNDGHPSGDSNHIYIGYHNVRYDYMLKVKPMKPSVVFNALKYAGFNPAWTDAYNEHLRIPGRHWDRSSLYASLDRFVDYMSTFNDSTFEEDAETTEAVVYNFWQLAYQLSSWFTTMCSIVLSMSPNESRNFDNRIFHLRVTSNNVTNTQWVRLASGWDGDDQARDYVFTESIPLFNHISPEITTFYVGEIAKAYIEMFLFQTIDRVANPTDYMFLPYCRDICGWDPSIYGINNDEQNGKAVMDFLQTATTVVVIAAAAVVVGAVVGKIRRAFYFKRAGFIGQMDNKMWNGGTLTADEMKKYVRYARRLNASSLLTGGLLNTASSMGSSLLSNSTGDLSISDLLSFSNVRGDVSNTEASLDNSIGDNSDVIKRILIGDH